MIEAAPLPPLSPRQPTGGPRFQRLRVIAALIIRDMSARFGRSAGGYFWALAEPLGGILLLSVAFQFALRSPEPIAAFVALPMTWLCATWLGTVASTPPATVAATRARNTMQ